MHYDDTACICGNYCVFTGFQRTCVHYSDIIFNSSRNFADTSHSKFRLHNTNCVHRASCKHLKALTRAMHICSCVMQECDPHVFMQMTMTVCMCTLVPRPFVVEKPTRNAVTDGLLAECFFTISWLVYSMMSFRHHIWPTQPSIRDEWMTHGSHLSPLEKKRGAFDSI